MVNEGCFGTWSTDIVFYEWIASEVRGCWVLRRGSGRVRGNARAVMEQTLEDSTLQRV